MTAQSEPHAALASPPPGIAALTVKVGDTAWSLGIRNGPANAADRPLTLRSPAAQGRTGAGYGGFFWRGPAIIGAARILSPHGTDVPGAVASWLAITRHILTMVIDGEVSPAMAAELADSARSAL